MKFFVTEYIKGCTTCQMTKVNTHPTHPPMFPITPTDNVRPFETVAMDFITKLPQSGGFNTILRSQTPTAPKHPSSSPVTRLLIQKELHYSTSIMSFPTTASPIKSSQTMMSNSSWNSQQNSVEFSISIRTSVQHITLKPMGQVKEPIKP